MSAGSYKQALGCFRVQGSGPQGSTCSLVEKASVLLSSQRMCKQLFSRNLLAQSTIHVPIDALFFLVKVQLSQIGMMFRNGFLIFNI